MTGKEKARLRGQGQLLAPAVIVGKDGATEEVERAIARALNASELVKVRVNADRDERARIAEQLVARLGAELVGAVGGTLLFFRPRAEPAADEGTA
jgi:RNA-binding protein